MQPLLLRSAGVVGIAGAIVAVISSDALFGGADAPPAVPLVAPQGEADAAATVAVVRVPPSDDLVAPATGVFEPTPSFAAAAADPAPSAGSAPAPAASAPAAAPAEPLPAAAPSAPVAAANIEAAPKMDLPSASAATASVAAAPAEPAQSTATAADGSLWPEEAVECPRDWVAVEEQGTSGAQTECREVSTSQPEVAALEHDQQAIGEAALERAAEMGGLEFAPRIPKVRPDPPPQRRRTARRTARADWPADPPPDCGTKYARWRYVNDVPTWFCGAPKR